MGTGTFLSEIIKHIYKGFEGQQGIWSKYVEDHLIPRLNGFEILMASYSMAHLKLELILQQTGYIPKKQQRLRVYLTNSLEEHHPDMETRFANWLSTEANEANHIKRDSPVMVVIGNPPYRGESKNKGEWIMNLMEDYKKEPGGEVKLKEHNPKWINNDYVKFLRYGQYLIDSNTEGILAFINDHSFLDNPTFRGMRWKLLKSFDKLLILNLHGNKNRNEKCPDGTKDDGVFDIKQGVSINIFIKTNKKNTNSLGNVYYKDLYGVESFKYNYLWENNVESVKYNPLSPSNPQFYFVPKDFQLQNRYKKGFLLTDCFPINSVGIVTSRNGLVIDFNKATLSSRLNKFFNLPIDELKTELKIKDSNNWKINNVRESAKFNEKYMEEISYKPFDNRFIYYDDINFIERSRINVMKHFLAGENIGIVSVNRQPLSNPTSYYFISKNIISNGYIRSDSVSIDLLSPLYLYNDIINDELFIDGARRVPNLNKEIVHKLADTLDLVFKSEKENNHYTFAPLDILDYIYAVLHSPTYRKKYKEFLKIDFPRVPYPVDKKTFWKLVKIGSQIRQIHLLESPKVENFITTYPVDGDDTVTRRLTKNDWEITNEKKQLGCIWINDKQYFDRIPLVAWEFYIGGYQPAQKWLKDRRGRELSFEDIQHYQKIIVALTETDRLMKEVDKVGVEW